CLLSHIPFYAASPLFKQTLSLKRYFVFAADNSECDFFAPLLGDTSSVTQRAQPGACLNSAFVSMTISFFGFAFEAVYDLDPCNRDAATWTFAHALGASLNRRSFQLVVPPGGSDWAATETQTNCRATRENPRRTPVDFMAISQNGKGCCGRGHGHQKPGRRI